MSSDGPSQPPKSKLANWTEKFDFLKAAFALVVPLIAGLLAAAAWMDAVETTPKAWIEFDRSPSAMSWGYRRYYFYDPGPDDIRTCSLIIDIEAPDHEDDGTPKQPQVSVEPSANATKTPNGVGEHVRYTITPTTPPLASGGAIYADLICKEAAWPKITVTPVVADYVVPEVEDQRPVLPLVSSRRWSIGAVVLTGILMAAVIYWQRTVAMDREADEYERGRLVGSTEAEGAGQSVVEAMKNMSEDEFFSAWDKAHPAGPSKPE